MPYDPLPASFDDLPEGPATTLPWWQGGKLHVGEATIKTRLKRMASRAGTTVVGRGRGSHGSTSEWYLVRRDRLKRLPMTNRSDRPLVSANGRWIAWLDERAKPVSEFKDDVRYRVVAYDAEQREVVDIFHDRRLVLWEDGINGIWLRSLDNRGRTVFTLGREGEHLWKPGRKPRKLTGDLHGTQDMDGWPRGLTQYRLRDGVGFYGTVDGHGVVTDQGQIRMPSVGFWSETGDGYLYTDYDAEPLTFWVDRIDEGLSVQLGVPAEGSDEVQVVGWESATDVILWRYERWHDPVSILVRCDAITGDCERVEGGPRAGRPAVMPSRF